MAPKRALCQVCDSTESKYTCSKCPIIYCSVACYKKHQANTCSSLKQRAATPPPTNLSSEAQSSISSVGNTASPGNASREQLLPDASVDDGRPLRPLASLKWPYVPEESAFPDPLKRDDPKPLQLPQYEAISTSPGIRRVLASNPRLREILRSVDVLRGEEREQALHEALGVGESRGKILIGRESEEDQRALRDLAEAIEAAVRGGKQDMLGLDWGD
ncbi:hypothetical protein C8Q78DRAFT_1062567 [Trametes maxima]|nr:hypothetical protein C8Q78DRAFT_1062567 [Trametes maxima]